MYHVSTCGFFNFFKIKIVTCQYDIVPRGRDNVMWQW